jgi:hypothetical protein
MIPRSWAEPSSGLSPTDLHVAIALLSFGGSDPAHPAFPSLGRVAKITGLSVRTVRRSVSKMVRLKKLRAQTRIGGTTAYTIIVSGDPGHPRMSRPTPDKSASTPGQVDDRGGGQSSVPGGGRLDDRLVDPVVSNLHTQEQRAKEKQKLNDENRRHLRALITKMEMAK